MKGSAVADVMRANCRSCLMQVAWIAELYFELLQGFWARLRNLYNIWRSYSYNVNKIDPIMSQPW